MNKEADLDLLVYMGGLPEEIGPPFAYAELPSSLPTLMVAGSGQSKGSVE